MIGTDIQRHRRTHCQMAANQIKSGVGGEKVVVVVVARWQEYGPWYSGLTLWCVVCTSKTSSAQQWQTLEYRQMSLNCAIGEAMVGPLSWRMEHSFFCVRGVHCYITRCIQTCYTVSVCSTNVTHYFWLPGTKAIEGKCEWGRERVCVCVLDEETYLYKN